MNSISASYLPLPQAENRVQGSDARLYAAIATAVAGAYRRRKKRDRGQRTAVRARLRSRQAQQLFAPTPTTTTIDSSHAEKQHHLPTPALHSLGTFHSLANRVLLPAIFRGSCVPILYLEIELFWEWLPRRPPFPPPKPDDSSESMPRAIPAAHFSARMAQWWRLRRVTLPSGLNFFLCVRWRYTFVPASKGLRTRGDGCTGVFH